MYECSQRQKLLNEKSLPPERSSNRVGNGPHYGGVGLIVVLHGDVIEMGPAARRRVVEVDQFQQGHLMQLRAGRRKAALQGKPADYQADNC